MQAAGQIFGLLFIVAQFSFSQSVSDSNGRILFADKDGATKALTDGNLDFLPCLSSDKKSVVFVHHTPGFTVETGQGDVEKTELWIAYVDGRKKPRRVSIGGAFIEGPNINVVVAGFGNPQFSPDASRIYFTAAAYATQAAILMLDVSTSKVKLLFTGLSVDVIRRGK